MVRTKAKKKANPADPFKKRKQKVGKKKLEPVAATKAEIHSTTIYLKKQARDAGEETKEYLNARKLSFAEVMTRLKHYSTNTRKEALLQLVQMLQVTSSGQAEAVPPSMHGTVLNTALPQLCDPNGETRRAASALLRAAVVMLEKLRTGDTGMPPLRAMAPLIVRHCTVALTHMDADTRGIGCQSLLHLLPKLQGSELPDAWSLLASTETLFRGVHRPRQGVQAPAMQAYLAVLESVLVNPPAVPAVSERKEDQHSASLPPLLKRARGEKRSAAPIQSAKAAAAAAAVEQAKTIPDLRSSAGVLQYMQSGVLGALEEKWVEATQDMGSMTVVGEWELGLLQALNMLVSAVSARHTRQSTPLLRRLEPLGKAFSHRLRGHFAEPFPFEPGTIAARANAHLALFLSTFLPTDAAKLQQWASSLLRGTWTRALRPDDIAATCVVFERLGMVPPAAPPSSRKAAAEGDSSEEDDGETDDSLAKLLEAAGAAGSPGQLTVLASLRRIADRHATAGATLPPNLASAAERLPQILYEAARRATKEQPVTASVATLRLVTTAEGGELRRRRTVSENDPAAAVREAVRLLVRLAARNALDADLCADVQVSLFGAVAQDVWHQGVFAMLPADAAADAVALLPAIWRAVDDGAGLIESVDHAVWQPGLTAGSGTPDWLAALSIEVLDDAGAFAEADAAASLRSTASAAAEGSGIAAACARALHIT